MRYSKAPISEVIMGIGYRNAKIPVDFILKKALFSEQFPIVEIVQPLCVEILNGYQVQPNFDRNSGPFLVRRWTSDEKWLLQMQANMLYLNWIRLDTEPVGTYVGFISVKDKFLSILADLEENTKVNLRSDVILCDLTYNDRIKWQSEISDLSEIGKIMHVSAPPKFSDQGYNNVFSRYTFHDFELNGFGLININTVTAIDGEQLIKLESSLRGRCVIDGDIETWFEQAHTKHNEIFERIFTEEIKAKWQ
jgi:uncharacterized protein (TIGR04255 family)